MERFHHVGISVLDLSRSVAFYALNLGLDLKFEGEFSGDHYDTVLGLEGAQGRVAFLTSLALGLSLELFEFISPQPRKSDQARPVCDHGITHFCVQVDDIDKVYVEMNRAGVPFHSAPVRFPRSGNRVAYARDPDGNVIELLELHRPQT